MDGDLAARVRCDWLSSRLRKHTQDGAVNGDLDQQ